MTEATSTTTVIVADFDPALAQGTFTVIDRNRQAHLLPGVNGVSLMELMRGYDMPVKATCGGAAACGTCHVFVDEPHLNRLPAPRAEEQEQLDHILSVQATSRLGCQILWSEAMLDGLVVTLGPNEDF